MKTLFTLFIALALSAISADEFALLGATEAQMTERYGDPVSELPFDPRYGFVIPAFEKSMVYKMPQRDFPELGFDFQVALIKGRAEGLYFRRRSGLAIEFEVKQFLERCGGEWKKTATGWVRKDGTLASMESYSGLMVLSPVAAKALNDFRNETAKNDKPIKGL